MRLVIYFTHIHTPFVDLGVHAACMRVCFELAPPQHLPSPCIHYFVYCRSWFAVTWLGGHLVGWDLFGWGSGWFGDLFGWGSGWFGDLVGWGSVWVGIWLVWDLVGWGSAWIWVWLVMDLVGWRYGVDLAGWGSSWMGICVDGELAGGIWLDGDMYGWGSGWLGSG